MTVPSSNPATSATPGSAVTLATSSDKLDSLRSLAGILILGGPLPRSTASGLVVGASLGDVVLNGPATPASDPGGPVVGDLDPLEFTNTPPEAVADYATVDEDAPGVEIDVTANDTDADGHVLFLDSWEAVTPHGTLERRDNLLYYAPDPDFNGTDYFTYIVEDGWGGTAEGTVLVTVGEVNDAPVAFNDAFAFDPVYNQPPPEFTTIAQAGLLANDRDVDQWGSPPPFQVYSTDLTGTIGIVSVAADGSFSYRPPLNFLGVTSFTYRVSDGAAISEPATVYLFVNQVTAPNQPGPQGWFATKDAYAVGDDPVSPPAAEGVLVNDHWDGVAVVTSQPSVGRLTAFHADGSFTYVPPRERGPDVFGYKFVCLTGTEGAQVVLFSVDLNLRNAQETGRPVAEKVEESVGAFTVANRNNTDGDLDMTVTPPPRQARPRR